MRHSFCMTIAMGTETRIRKFRFCRSTNLWEAFDKDDPYQMWTRIGSSNRLSGRMERRRQKYAFPCEQCVHRLTCLLKPEYSATYEEAS